MTVDLAMHGQTSEGWTSTRERGVGSSCAMVWNLLERPDQPEETGSNEGTLKSE